MTERQAMLLILGAVLVIVGLALVPGLFGLVAVGVGGMLSHAALVGYAIGRPPPMRRPPRRVNGSYED